MELKVKSLHGRKRHQSDVDDNINNGSSRRYELLHNHGYISYIRTQRGARGGNKSRGPRGGALYYVCMTLFIIYFIWPRLT